MCVVKGLCCFVLGPFPLPPSLPPSRKKPTPCALTALIILLRCCQVVQPSRPTPFPSLPPAALNHRCVPPPAPEKAHPPTPPPFTSPHTDPHRHFEAVADRGPFFLFFYFFLGVSLKNHLRQHLYSAPCLPTPARAPRHTDKYSSSREWRRRRGLVGGGAKKLHCHSPVLQRVPKLMVSILGAPHPHPLLPRETAARRMRSLKRRRGSRPDPSFPIIVNPTPPSLPP